MDDFDDYSDMSPAELRGVARDLRRRLVRMRAGADQALAELEGDLGEAEAVVTAWKEGRLGELLEGWGTEALHDRLTRWASWVAVSLSIRGVESARDAAAAALPGK